MNFSPIFFTFVVVVVGVIVGVGVGVGVVGVFVGVVVEGREGVGEESMKVITKRETINFRVSARRTA